MKNLIKINFRCSMDATKIEIDNLEENIQIHNIEDRV